jgi:hypothetical protein
MQLQKKFCSSQNMMMMMMIRRRRRRRTGLCKFCKSFGEVAQYLLFWKIDSWMQPIMRLIQRQEMRQACLQINYFPTNYKLIDLNSISKHQSQFKCLKRNVD